MFDNSGSCNISSSGSYAKSYWLWATGECLPIYLHGVITNSFYRMGRGRLLFECGDRHCHDCQFDLSGVGGSNHSVARQCLPLPNSQSLQVGRPLINSWEGERAGDIVANMFFTESFCIPDTSYAHPQVFLQFAF